MATVEEVARAALGDLAGGQEHVALAVRWVNERYREFTSIRLKQTRKVGAFVIPAAISAGTVTVARGNTVVAGDATADAAWVDQTGSILGRYFRARQNWYRITGTDTITSAPNVTTALRLEVPFAEDDVTAGTYRIVQRYAALHPEAGFLGTFLFPRLWRELDMWSPDELDLHAPARLYVGGGPWIVSDAGENEDGQRIVECYPYSETSEEIVYVYWRTSRTLDHEEELPGALDANDLKQGVLINVMLYRMSQALQRTPPNVEEAALWRNEYRAQETRWENVKQRMVRRDRGLPDNALLLRDRRVRAPLLVANAQEELFVRGARP